jgi:SAM-dependent methyltransferase
MSTRKIYEPVLSQYGKDCVWEPTPYHIIDLMLKIGKITPNDVVMDLGSGDGRIPIATANFGAFGIGVEYNHDLVIYSRNLAKKNGVVNKTKFIEGDIYNIDMSKASLITLFLNPKPMEDLYPVLSNLKHGTRIVSYVWNFDNWEPDFKLSVGENRLIFLWILPQSRIMF